MAAGDITIVAKDVFGTRNVVTGTVEAAGAAWPAGGYAFTAAALGLASIEHIDFEPYEITATTFVQPVYVRSIDKVTIFDGGGAGASFPEANADDSSATGGIRFMAYGRAA